MEGIASPLSLGEGTGVRIEKKGNSPTIEEKIICSLKADCL